MRTVYAQCLTVFVHLSTISIILVNLGDFGQIPSPSSSLFWWGAAAAFSPHPKGGGGAAPRVARTGARRAPKEINPPPVILLNADRSISFMRMCYDSNN
jgi:hypothetical protein